MEGEKLRVFDLEGRTLDFAKSVLLYLKNLEVNIINRELVRQCIRSSGSVGSNYREANDSLGQKDFLFRMKIVRKEAKETLFWLELLEFNNNAKDTVFLKKECTELIKIFSSIIKKFNKTM